MTDPRLITDEELAALRGWYRGHPCRVMPVEVILARNPEPWSPSEDDITAYYEAKGWDPSGRDLNYGRQELVLARERGWDAVPRRIEGGAR